MPYTRVWVKGQVLSDIMSFPLSLSLPTFCPFKESAVTPQPKEERPGDEVEKKKKMGKMKIPNAKKKKNKGERAPSLVMRL